MKREAKCLQESTAGQMDAAVSPGTLGDNCHGNWLYEGRTRSRGWSRRDHRHISHIILIFVIFLGKYHRIRTFIRAHRGGIWSPVHKAPGPQRLYVVWCQVFESFLYQKTHTRSKSISFSWRKGTLVELSLLSVPFEAHNVARQPLREEQRTI